MERATNVWRPVDIDHRSISPGKRRLCFVRLGRFLHLGHLGDQLRSPGAHPPPTLLHPHLHGAVVPPYHQHGRLEGALVPRQAQRAHLGDVRIEGIAQRPVAQVARLQHLVHAHLAVRRGGSQPQAQVDRRELQVSHGLLALAQLGNAVPSGAQVHVGRQHRALLLPDCDCLVFRADGQNLAELRMRPSHAIDSAVGGLPVAAGVRHPARALPIVHLDRVVGAAAREAPPKVVIAQVRHVVAVPGDEIVA
eukprot:scaffold302_cov247-Pinguiococcus_pyrenoidosus.AAC.25